ncbi:MAG: transcription elongation factor subunit Spt4 [archaeon]
MSEKACRICHRITEEKECEVCKNKDLTRNWKGVLIVYEAVSEMGTKADRAIPGRYALQIY